MWTPTIALLPGALTIYLGFDGGGYFPPATGVACAVLAIALVVRLTLAERPLEGFGLGAALVTAALGLFAVWALVSSSWSDSPARAVAEFDRALLYMLMLALLATLPRTTETARTVMFGIAGGMTLLCMSGLATRVLPDVFPIAPNVLDQRLSYPVTYWNGVGLVAALAIVFATHLTSSAREHVAARVTAAAFLPLLAATLYFTFSRASIVVMVVGVVGYVVLARPRGLVPALIAVVPPTIIAVVWAYNADLLARPDPTTAAAVDQGHEVFIVLVLCALAAGAVRYALIHMGLDERLLKIDVPKRTRNVFVATTAGVLLLAAGTAWIAFDMNDRISRQYEKFKEGDVIRASEDARERLTAVGNNGRIQHWEEAIDAFSSDPLKGTGAGTYELTWAQNRPSDFTVRDGHSLYLETLSELGLVGGVLLVLALGGILVALGMRAGGHGRGLWSALFIAGCVWALHAAQDWVWELPAVTAWLFAAGGIALARPPGAPETPTGGAVADRAGGRGARRARARGHAHAQCDRRRAPARQRDRLQGRRLRHRDRQGAVGDVGARRAAGAVRDPGLLRRPPRRQRARGANDAGRGRARPEQLGLPLRAGARPGGRGRESARRDRGGAPAQPPRTAHDRCRGGVRVDERPREMEKAGPEGPPSNPVS